MNEKRFMLTDNGYIYDTRDKAICHTIGSVVKLLNDQHEKNEELAKDNLKTLALLGDVRALLRMNNTERAIEKINKFEKELFK